MAILVFIGNVSKFQYNSSVETWCNELKLDCFYFSLPYPAFSFKIDKVTQWLKLFFFFFFQDLLYRRMRSLVNYQNANKALEKARAKNKEVQQAEKNQEEACNKFEKLSEVAKQELTDYKTRRVAAFKKNLVELAELQLKHAKVFMFDFNLWILLFCWFPFEEVVILTKKCRHKRDVTSVVLSERELVWCVNFVKTWDFHAQCVWKPLSEVGIQKVRNLFVENKIMQEVHK